jgi:hypothetical protein
METPSQLQQQINEQAGKDKQGARLEREKDTILTGNWPK